jgi:hypothetical protein
MAAENPTWGEERIADELWLKLQILLSPRTTRKYIGQAPRPHGTNGQRWSTFIRNYANGIVACDFLRFRNGGVPILYIFVYIFVAPEIGSRRLLHINVAEHPTSEWTLQQVREALPGDQDYKLLLHDRHKTFSASLDETVESWGRHVLRSQFVCETANAHCERLRGASLQCWPAASLIRSWHSWSSPAAAGSFKAICSTSFPSRVTAKPISAACIANMNGHGPRELLDDIIAEAVRLLEI